MRVRRSGLTLIEVMFVVVIAAIMLSMGSRGYATISNQRAVGNARDAVIQSAYRARSEAMRSGRVVFLRVRPDSGLVRVMTASDSVIHTLDIRQEYRTTIIGNPLSICYAARGYALPGCTTFSTTRALGFVRSADTAAVEVLPLGQVRRKQ